jgi:hypothetical protein
MCRCPKSGPCCCRDEDYSPGGASKSNNSSKSRSGFRAPSSRLQPASSVTPAKRKLTETSSDTDSKNPKKSKKEEELEAEIAKLKKEKEKLQAEAKAAEQKKQAALNPFCPICISPVPLASTAFFRTCSHSVCHACLQAMLHESIRAFGQFPSSVTVDLPHVKCPLCPNTPLDMSVFHGSELVQPPQHQLLESLGALPSRTAPAPCGCKLPSSIEPMQRLQHAILCPVNVAIAFKCPFSDCRQPLNVPLATANSDAYEYAVALRKHLNTECKHEVYCPRLSCNQHSIQISRICNHLLVAREMDDWKAFLDHWASKFRAQLPLAIPITSMDTKEAMGSMLITAASACSPPQSVGDAFTEFKNSAAREYSRPHYMKDSCLKDRSLTVIITHPQIHIEPDVRSPNYSPRSPGYSPRSPGCKLFVLPSLLHCVCVCVCSCFVR